MFWFYLILFFSEALKVKDTNCVLSVTLRSKINRITARLLLLLYFNIVHTIRDYEKEGHTTREMDTEAKKHLKEKDYVQSILPDSIMIGPYNVTVDGVRDQLVTKRKALAMAVLQLIAKEIRQLAEDVMMHFCVC